MQSLDPGEPGSDWKDFSTLEMPETDLFRARWEQSDDRPDYRLEPGDD